MDDKQKYKEALERAKIIYTCKYKPEIAAFCKQSLENIFPDLAESVDDEIRKELLVFCRTLATGRTSVLANNIDFNKWISWLEKQGRQKPIMIQWQGNNLKEVIDFTGKDKNFEKWFKSFEEYEKYVDDHNGIFKLFNADGNHYEVPIGSWIVKTPDGYNVASKAFFRQKNAWSEEDEVMIKVFDSIIRYIVEVVDKDALERFGTNREELFSWLKSLKDRIQPKVELTQLDKNILEAAIAFVEQNNHFNYWRGVDKHTVLSALYSLRSQKQWKPSDEQIKALFELLPTRCSSNPIFSLYNDLKKL